MKLPLLRINLPDKTIGLLFEHPSVTRYLSHPDTLSPGHFVTRRKSICSVFEVKGEAEPKLLSKGIVTCYFKDNFWKEAGRKSALRSALTKTGFSRFERGIIWKAYHERPRVSGIRQEETCTEHSVEASSTNLG